MGCAWGARSCRVTRYSRSVPCTEKARPYGARLQPYAPRLQPRAARLQPYTARLTHLHGEGTAHRVVEVPRLGERVRHREAYAASEDGDVEQVELEADRLLGLPRGAVQCACSVRMRCACGARAVCLRCACSARAERVQCACGARAARCGARAVCACSVPMVCCASRTSWLRQN